MISNRKAKKLLARGNRLRRVAEKHYRLGPRQYQEKYGRINKTSDMLSDILSGWEMAAIDAHMLACAIG